MILKVIDYEGINIYRLINGIQHSDKYDQGISLFMVPWYTTPMTPWAKVWPNSVVLANSEYEYDHYTDLGIETLYCNQNAFLNEDRYKILPDATKSFDMVVSSCYRDYKRVSLCKEVPNVLHIGYVNGPLEYIPDFGFRANFQNNSTDITDWRYICTKRYTSLVNSAVCGGIFSDMEGACFASSEYLLCGLPVISTKSVGGRDVFYNTENSIICDDNTTSVRETFDALSQNISLYDPHRIRENKLYQMNYFRDVLTSYVKDQLEDKYGVSVDYRKLSTLLKHYDNSNEW